MKTLKAVLNRFEFDWSFFLMLTFIIFLNIFMFILEIRTVIFDTGTEFESAFYHYFTGFLTGVFITTIFTEILLILKDLKDEEAEQ